MFVEHKQLKVLNVAASKVARLNSSACNVQMAFAGYPPQYCATYLVSLTHGNKVLVLVAFYLSESKRSVFFIPKQGEVSVEEAQEVYDEGFIFAETMGFVLNETDFHLLSTADQLKLWASLPICQATAAAEAPTQKAAAATATPQTNHQEGSLDEYRARSLASLGRFLASM